MVLEQLDRRLQGRAGGPGPTADACINALSAELEARFGKRLRRAEPLSQHALLGVGGPADLWLTVNTLDELVEAIGLARRYACPALLMGSGANLLVSDQGVRGLVIQNRCHAVEFDQQDEPRAIAQSGTNLAALARQAARRGLSGLEWAIGVPGTVGGAVVNNAGAHGACMADSVLRAELLTPAGARVWQPVEWFGYGYRSSRLKEQPPRAAETHVVLQVELRFCRKPPVEIEQYMVQINATRKSSQPGGASIGSMFKNPPGDYAGRLIESAGLKGHQIGGARISEVHANFFINTGSARAADFVALIQLARDTVRAQTGVNLEPEIQYAGDWSE
jgi:UDP-N-acetylmuramate dehydrogenase